MIRGSSMRILDTLNDRQKEAVTTCDSHLRIVAGAGSGKTRVVTTRIAYLIQEMGILPYRILAITFTNKAANEMKERVASMLGCEHPNVNISTIHSLCVRILREDIRELGYPKSFTILDSDDQKTILKSIYKELDVNVKDLSFGTSLSYISGCKCAFVNVEEAKTMASPFGNDAIKAEIYERYEKKQQEMYALDFDDLLLFVYRLFEMNQTIREKWQNRYDYIHVDEFQDVDAIQYGIIKHLMKKTSYLCVVGDPDQTIYTWRGASVDIIMNVEKDFLGCRSIVLNENYRSTPSILQGANSLIQNNSYRIEKELYTKNEDLGKIMHYQSNDENDEARFLIRQIKTLHEQGVAYRDMAILYRSNYLSRTLEKTMLDYQVPYRIYGGIKFFERAEIKDALSYLRLLVDDSKANELALKRIINVPRRGIGPKAIETLENLSHDLDRDFYSVLKQYPIAKGAAQQRIYEFVDLIESLRSQVKELSISILLRQILEKSGYIKALEDNHEEDRINNINELLHDIEIYEENNADGTLEEYLQMIALYTDALDNDTQSAFVQLMSVHSAKGLEFDYVFVYEMCEGIFPNERSINEGGKQALEEERRLAYVAYTRARKKLYLTSSQGYSFILQKMKSTSRFIKEMDAQVVESIGDVPSYQKQEYRYNAGDITIPSLKEKPSNHKKDRKTKLKKGDLIVHSTFGEGVVIALKDGVAQIAFDKKYGIRKLAANHAAITKK